MSVQSRARFVGAASAALASINIIPARAAQFELKYGHDLAPDHPLNVRSVEAFAKIKNDTNGRLSIKTFPNNILGGDPAMLSQLRSGALEVLAFPGAFLNAIVPIASIENVAYAFPNRDAAFRAMDGKVGELVRSDIRSKNIVVLDRIWENGFRNITTYTKPIRNVADLQGVRIRVSPGKIRFDTFASLGASPTPIAANELYTSLQTHIVDAQENPLLNIEVLKLYEVQKYCSLSNHMWTGYWILFNEDAWNKLPKDLQSVFARRMNEASLLARRDNELITRSLEEKLKRRGLIFNPVDTASFRKKLEASGYYARWKAEFGEKAWTMLEGYTGRLA